MLNIEIGNLTLGSAACCHTKDGLDGREFGQVSSYVTAIKWVNPAGELEEASEDTNPELLRLGAIELRAVRNHLRSDAAREADRGRGSSRTCRGRSTN